MEPAYGSIFLLIIKNLKELSTNVDFLDTSLDG
jgi:hypothetical protein